VAASPKAKAKAAPKKAPVKPQPVKQPDSPKKPSATSTFCGRFSKKEEDENLHRDPLKPQCPKTNLSTVFERISKKCAVKLMERCINKLEEDLNLIQTRFQLIVSDVETGAIFQMGPEGPCGPNAPSRRNLLLEQQKQDVKDKALPPAILDAAESNPRALELDIVDNVSVYSGGSGNSSFLSLENNVDDNLGSSNYVERKHRRRNKLRHLVKPKNSKYKRDVEDYALPGAIRRRSSLFSNQSRRSSMNEGNDENDSTAFSSVAIVMGPNDTATINDGTGIVAVKADVSESMIPGQTPQAGQAQAGQVL
jgi:hypothetical protein